jgi:acetyltransferase-like isoleucine patch superfamily enzyme
MRDAAKALARLVATLLALPALISYALRRIPLGADRALEGSSQSLGLIPGVVGDFIRGAFYAHVLEECAASVTIQFGTLFSQQGARIGDRVYVGPRCHLGLVHLEEDVLLAAGVHVPSGAATHGTDDLAVAIRDQPGRRTRVTIGAGTWVGSAAIVMADVGRHCVIGAGSIVTRPIPDYSFAAGNPARVIRDRRSAVAQTAPWA